MSRRKISQTEAHELSRRVIALEKILSEQRKDWRGDWPDYEAVLARHKPGEQIIAIVSTARKLKHAVVVTVQDDSLVFFGCKTEEL